MSYNQKGRAVFNVSGTYTWTCPSNTQSVTLTMIGGGGGGAGGGGGGSGYYITSGQSASGNYAGGGGGASGAVGTNGQFLRAENIPVVPGTTYTVVVGAAGAGGAGGAGAVVTSFNQTINGSAGTTGNTGGDTKFVFPSTYSIAARGGAGGYQGAYGTGATTSNTPGTGGVAVGTGSQSGLGGGGLGNAANTILLANVTTYGYSGGNSLYTFYASGSTPPTLPSTIFSFSVSGNNANDSFTFATLARVSGGGNYTPNSGTTNYGAGGYGGIVSLPVPQPIYFVGVDVSSVSSVSMPYFVTVNGVGMGTGASFSTPAGAASSTSVHYWSTGITATGYGAGGLGGPGGGGGAATLTLANACGGSGYKGDTGLQGLCIINY